MRGVRSQVTRRVVTIGSYMDVPMLYHHYTTGELDQKLSFTRVSKASRQYGTYGGWPWVDSPFMRVRAGRKVGIKISVQYDTDHFAQKRAKSPMYKKPKQLPYTGLERTLGVLEMIVFETGKCSVQNGCIHKRNVFASVGGLQGERARTGNFTTAIRLKIS